ncbi:MAG: N-acetylmuramoyl-L-alanine amidase, partial [Fibrobacter sp.]|nr:N-acetylmuramoyl-L-alanine amidase [Fibrobacter sp.]
MKKVIYFLLFAIACTASIGAAPEGVAAKVDVELFAKEKKAAFHWFPVQKTFNLTTAKDTVKFAMGLPYASMGNRSIPLETAPEIVDGKIWISAKDTSKIFQEPTAVVAPVAIEATAVATPKNETAGTREVKTVVIDPGHGGKDSGALGANAQEKDIVLSVGKLLKKELEKEGFNVKMTRDKDVFIELGQRANLANQWDGDLFISLHCNAIDATAERKKQIKGYHVYVLRAPESEEDKAIARRENKVATLYGEKNAKEELSPIEWFK